MEGVCRSSYIEAAAVAEIVEVVKIVEAERPTTDILKTVRSMRVMLGCGALCARQILGRISYHFKGQG
jgi:hypothetical protein